jgi:hypothetical protein
MKENYRGYMLEYEAVASGAPAGGYVLRVCATPPTLRGQVPPMRSEVLSTAATAEKAIKHAQAEAQSLVDQIAPHTFTNVDLAAHQLQRALILFFEDGDYLSAVTLAHAAYGILTKIGVEPGEPDHRERLADIIVEITAIQGTKISRKDAIRLISDPANALKHPDGDRRPPGMPFQASIVELAADVLNLAVTEAFRVTHLETALMRRFREWHREGWLDEDPT